tara:strand:- start:1638 stop:2105 length:468 start_codon:yes stop_codon:yes gene_type:complete
MKKSELKSFIREEIINTLSEQEIEGFGIGKDDAEIEKLKKDFDSAKSGADLPPEATVQDIAAYYAANPPKMVSEDEDDDRDAVRGAMKARGKFKKLDLAVKALKNLEKEMVALAKEYGKTKDGKRKEDIKNILRKKTPIKKEAEALVKRLEKDVV